MGGTKIERDAFTGLLIAELPALRRIALHRWGGNGEDFLQEALVRAWRWRDRFRFDGNLRPWLLSIMWRVAVESFRGFKNQRFAGIPEGIAARADRSEISPDDADALAFALSLISPAETELLRMAAEGVPYDDIAAHFGCTKTAIKLRVHKARGRIRRQVN